MEYRYELDHRAIQKMGTNQCWWLSMLEVARASHKLDPIFSSQDSRLHKYYTEKGGWTPNEGELPSGMNDQQPLLRRLVKRSKNDRGKYPWDKLRKLLVYGPEWQRMIMYFLLDNGAPYFLPNETCPTRDRSARLGLLIDSLGIRGITFPTSYNLTGLNVRGIVNGLLDGQWLIVDKTGHAMSGCVEQMQLPFPHNIIRVYNQARQESSVYSVIVDPKSKTPKLMEEGSETESNWIMPVNIDH